MHGIAPTWQQCKQHHLYVFAHYYNAPSLLNTITAHSPSIIALAIDTMHPVQLPPSIILLDLSRQPEIIIVVTGMKLLRANRFIFWQ
jgi:hypothetical protein